KLKDTLYKGGLPKKLIHTPGLLNAIGFKILDPKGWYEGHKQLLLNLDDKELLHEHATLGNFLNHMVDYPGGVNQDMLFNVWLQNPLKNGAIQLSNHKIELRIIDCSLLIGAGKNDQMVTADAVKPLSELTKSSDVTFTLIPGGHLGLMSSQKSADEFWPTLSRWLEQRSTKI
ncbi:MAG: alpha/beta hydrolase, partial [Acinetobacter sp.]|nr:alpha/beta hydrolase [Acinetobacter sp.]